MSTWSRPWSSTRYSRPASSWHSTTSTTTSNTNTGTTCHHITPTHSACTAHGAQQCRRHYTRRNMLSAGSSAARHGAARRYTAARYENELASERAVRRTVERRVCRGPRCDAVNGTRSTEGWGWGVTPCRAGAPVQIHPRLRAARLASRGSRSQRPDAATRCGVVPVAGASPQPHRKVAPLSITQLQQ